MYLNMCFELLRHTVENVGIRLCVDMYMSLRQVPVHIRMLQTWNESKIFVINSLEYVHILL